MRQPRLLPAPPAPRPTRRVPMKRWFVSYLMLNLLQIISISCHYQMQRHLQTAVGAALAHDCGAGAMANQRRAWGGTCAAWTTRPHAFCLVFAPFVSFAVGPLVHLPHKGSLS